MTGGEDRLRRIAERIVESQPVDWESESGEGEDVATQMENLRALERIRALHQGEPTRKLEGDDVARAKDAARTHRGSRWGPLELVEPVGMGSYGEVWRAWDSRLETHVALKLLFPRGQSTEEVLGEARQMAKIRHENVVTVHGAAEHDGRVGIWTSFIRGTTLERRLDGQGPMGAAEAAVIVTDLCRAVAAVHAVGLVHRDIKTSNVMREEGGRIVLMDFGTVVDRSSIEGMSDDQAFTGTAPYMAPELFAGNRPNRSSDLYALGVVLYRMVTGRYPRDAEGDLRRKHEEGNPTNLRDARPDLPAEFVRIVDRALAAQPAERFATAGEMERDLVRFLASSDTAAQRRNSWPLLAVAGGVILAAWFGWRQLAGGGLDVQAALFRDGAGVEERLPPGGRVHPGDQLFLELEASDDAYAYVFAEDEIGNAYLLFPLSGVEQSNPLPGRAKHRLPGVIGGEEQRWGVDSAGGEEALFVIVSGEPLAGLEAEMRALPEAGSGVPLQISPDRIRRGIGQLAPAPRQPAGDRAPALSGIFGELSTAAVDDDDLWTWSIRLANPVP